MTGACGTARAVLLSAAALTFPLLLAGHRRQPPPITLEMEAATRAVLARTAADLLMRRVTEAGEADLYRRIFGQDPPQQ